MTPEQRIAKAVNIASEYGGIDGGHHKMWVIDQILRVLLDANYDEYIKGWCAGEDGPDTYSWDVGIAP
jgi:hypothetical protein